ncbi:MAG: putative selenium-dependent hydroxylase accessory protein YqeC [Acidimicrobiia bacterium]|nr:putative selenium-dependent hydroxylase accessory protein YqeC [Acidimicrobiia bacterium]NNF09169.1 putative selenium-dependent hydroxylase accessory protein YqeC [Acidimicrobiia bacterium]NNL70049.1 putative selenium-dependent hydroxylase accessory protein YqeC [Acidimicrobiia bacterium]
MTELGEVIGDRELVALTGGGGKTTLLFSLAAELAGRGGRVIGTTTTKLGADQVSGHRVCWSADPAEVEAGLDGDGPLFVLQAGDDRKVTGYEPEVVDELYADSSATHVLVEADGARSRPLKAPAAHEPVIPGAATLVVVVMGIDALGRTLFEAAHRPPEAAALTGLTEWARITPAVAAQVLTHPDGGLKGVPAASRVVVALTKVAPAAGDAAEELEGLLAGHGRIERVIRIPRMAN